MFDGSPLNRSRLVTKDTNIILPNGNKMTLPKDSIILCNMYHMNMSCHNQKWHSNTAMNKFDVNRWINKDTNTLDTKLKVHTFGAGKRNCVGQSLAERQLYMFTAEILRNYKLSLPNNAEINIKMNFLKTTQVSPVWLKKEINK